MGGSQSTGYRTPFQEEEPPTSNPGRISTVTARVAGSASEEVFNSLKDPGPSSLANPGGGMPRALGSRPGTQQSRASPFKTLRPVTIPQNPAGQGTKF